MLLISLSGSTNGLVVTASDVYMIQAIVTSGIPTSQIYPHRSLKAGECTMLKDVLAPCPEKELAPVNTNSDT